MRIKHILILAVSLILGSCGKESKQQIEKDIAAKKKEIRSLKQDIQALKQNMQDKYGTTADQNKIPVGIQTLKYDTFRHFVEINGETTAKKEAFISPETNGRIDVIHAEEGDYVEKGQLLAKLNTSVIRNNLQEVKTKLELAKTMYEKRKRLWEKDIGSEIQYLEAKNKKESLENRLETLQSQLEMAQIHAPFSGTIVEIMQKEGEMGAPAARLMHLVDISQLEIETSVSEEYIARIKKGDQVIVQFPAYPNEKRTLAITRVADFINKDSRTFDIEINLNNASRKIKPHLISQIQINDYRNDSALIVPSIIIKQDMKGNFLFRLRHQNGKKVAQKTYVTTGKSFNNQTMIKEGVEPGDTVIIAGFNRVSDGLQVTIKQDMADKLPIGQRSGAVTIK